MSQLPQCKSNLLWDYFSKVAGSDKIATCNKCLKDLSYRTSVTNLKTHLKLKHGDIYKRTLSANVSTRRRSTWTDSSSNVKQQTSTEHQDKNNDTANDPLIDEETGDSVMGPGTDISDSETHMSSPGLSSDTSPLPERTASPPDRKPHPRRAFTSSLPRRRRRIPVRHDGLIAKRFLDIEEEKLRVSKERNNAINRVADILKQISNKLDEFI